MESLGKQIGRLTGIVIPEQIPDGPLSDALRALANEVEDWRASNAVPGPDGTGPARGC